MSPDAHPLRLTDAQLRAVLIAGGPLPPEKQSAFLERVAGHLRLVGYNWVAMPTSSARSAPRWLACCREPGA